MIQKDNLPAALRERGMFCCWRYEERGGKRTKVPYNPRTGGKAQSTNPQTFAPLPVALAAMNRGGYDGIGVGIFNGLGAIDIDHCVDEAGKLSKLALDVLNTVQGYTEYSPSGRGLRILFTIPAGFQYDKARYYINNQKSGLEVYIAGATQKYVTVTGNALNPGYALQDRGEQLAEVLEKYMVRPRSQTSTPRSAPAPLGWDSMIGDGDPDDLSLIERAKHSRKGAQFAVLWAGDITGYKSASEADIALCNALAFWTGKDAARMDRLFRQSGLFRRDKWDRHQSGSTYGAITIQNAIDSTRSTYRPREQREKERRRKPAAQDFAPAAPSGSTPPVPACPPAAPKAADLTPRLVRACDVPYEPPRWAIAPYFQRGKGTLVQGDNGTGKTAFLCAVAAHVSTGEPLLGLPIAAPGDVIMLSVEDDLPILRGRIEADGGDLGKCHFMTNVAGLTFTSPEIEAAVKAVHARMIIFDPLQAFMGAGVDMFRANETRPALAKLFEMCDRNDCACAIVSHMGKAGGDKSPVNRSLGSVDIPAAMRSILELTRNPDNEDECIMIHVKCSNAPKGQSIAYTIGDRGGIHWVGFSPMTAEDLTVVKKRKEKGIAYEKEPLVQVFNQLITDRPGGGFWSYADLKSEGAKILGFPPYADITDLRQKLDTGLARELQTRDGLIVTHSAKGKNNVRGVKLEQYKTPDCYQTRIESH